MSIIQKLENSYVAILRVVVIVVATFLLLAAAIMGTMSLKGMLPASPAQLEVDSIDPKDVVTAVASVEKTTTSDVRKRAEPEQTKVNPYLADYEKAYGAVSAFVNRTSKNTLEIDKAGFFEILDRNLSELGSDEVKAKYASGLAAAFSVSLADKRLIARVEKASPSAVAAQAPASVQLDGEESMMEEPVAEPEPVVEEQPYKESPFVVVDEVLTAYNTMFNQKLVEAAAKQDAAAAEYVDAKVSSTMRMYIAAGLFGTFLLVIFLTIAIRIERNLREMAARA